MTLYMSIFPSLCLSQIQEIDGLTSQNSSKFRTYLTENWVVWLYKVSHMVHICRIHSSALLKLLVFQQQKDEISRGWKFVNYFSMVIKFPFLVFFSLGVFWNLFECILCFYRPTKDDGMDTKLKFDTM